MDPAQIKEYRDAFMVFDVRQQGHLTMDELRSMMVTLGHTFSERELAKLRLVAERGTARSPA